MIQTRTERLLERLEDLASDAILVTGAANRRYLSGFTGTSGVLLIAPANRCLITDARYTEQARGQAKGFDVIEDADTLSRIAAWVTDYSIGRLGIEVDHTSLKQHEELIACLHNLEETPEVVRLEDVIETQRMVKDGVELAAIREAVRLADDIMAWAEQSLRVGVSERTLAMDLEYRMRQVGGDGPAFPTIVASGVNAAMAHHEPSEEKIVSGVPIVIDLGVRLDGYCSDITRTFILGSPDDVFREVYAIVLEAQLAVETGMRPGMTGREVDNLARNVIADADYADNFGHGTGHGVGLEIHEGPRLSPKGTNVLRAGAVTSVEPGIYLQGWGGVRIEDLVSLRENDVEVLTQSAK